MPRLKIKPRKPGKPRAFVHIGEIPDGASFIAHPSGGVIVVHPDHKPVWHRTDGTRQTLEALPNEQS